MVSAFYRRPRAPVDTFGALNASTFTVIVTTVGIGFYISSLQRAEKVADNIGAFLRSDADRFDFIVIGGGSGGGVVAARLSEEESNKVLLLEAGGDMVDLQLIPAMCLLLLKYPELDWDFKTIPQRHSCFAAPDNKSSWSAGKGLGGSSNANFMIHSRGNPRDYDNWARILKDESWSYKNVLPYFKKSETYHTARENLRVHGTEGPMHIEVPDYTGMANMYVEAAKELGYPRVDLNGYYKQGFNRIFYPMKEGRRHSVYSAYIDPASNRTNFTIRKFAYVKKILFDETKRAYGVLYDHHGIEKTAYSDKEIILSAGAINSPKILMLSGVGPRKHLKEIGIELVANLPVGKNLHDQISTYLGPFFIDKPLTFSIERDANAGAVAEFFTQGKGTLTTSGVQAMGFITSNYSEDKNWPDIELILSGVSIGADFAKNMARGYGLREDILTKYFAHAVGKESFSQIVSPVRPIARGEIRLKSFLPFDDLVIEPNYLNNEKDVKVMVYGIKKAMKLVERTKVFRAIGTSFTNTPFPGCEHIRSWTDAYWECYARHFSITQHHVVGTCSMGTVLDSNLMVRRVRGLRVVDASTMPVTVTGETNAATIMIGEKAADMIKSKWLNLADEWKR